LLLEGTLIAGRYEIQSPLASGGNGLVFAAIDLTTEKRVAIKVLGPHMLHERAAREKLRLEAIVAGRVESEHIVQVSDAGVDVNSGTPFLVMELLKGLDLQHHVEQHGPLDYATAIEYLRQVASGLDKAHGWRDRDGRAAPIVHRDLKPENLFLTYREDGTPLVKILDFGLAKVLSVSATLSSEVRGTPLYMAPEQFSQAPVTPAMDIWAFGLISFFFLTGKCYWLSARSESAVLPAVLKEVADGPTRPATVRMRELGVTTTLPEAFDDWFAKCVNLDPARRFAQASEAVRALCGVLDQPLVSSPLASPGSMLQANGRASWTELTPAAGEVVPRASVPPHAASEHRARTQWLKYVGAALVLLVAVLLIFARRPASEGSLQVAPVASVSPISSAPAGAEQPPTRPSSSAGGVGASAAPALSAPQREESVPSAQAATAASTLRDLLLRESAGYPTEVPKPKATNRVGPVPKSSSSEGKVSPGLGASKQNDAERPSHAVPPAASSSAPRAPRDPADHR
jgi:serine/threonine-protein kinase